MCGNWKTVFTLQQREKRTTRTQTQSACPYAIIFSLSLSLCSRRIVFAGGKKKVGVRWFFRFCISKWFWGFHLTQQQKQQPAVTARMTTNRESGKKNDAWTPHMNIHTSLAIVQISPIFVNKFFNIFSEQREKKIDSNTAHTHTHKQTHIANHFLMIFRNPRHHSAKWEKTHIQMVWLLVGETLYMISVHQILAVGKIEYVIMIIDVVGVFRLFCLTFCWSLFATIFFFTIWFKSSLVDYCGETLYTRTTSSYQHQHLHPSNVYVCVCVCAQWSIHFDYIRWTTHWICRTFTWSLWFGFQLFEGVLTFDVEPINNK